MVWAQGTQYWLAIGHDSCADDPEEEAYTLPQWGYIIICPQTLPPNQNHIVGSRRMDYMNHVPPVDIDDIAAAVSISILHEFMHALWPDISKCIL